MHRVGAAGNEGMPPGEFLPVRHQPVGAGRRQPGDRAHVLRRQPHAVVHRLQPVRIVGTAAGAGIEEAAADGREVDVARVLVLELGQAALAAAVAQRFPLRGGHLLEGNGLPERLRHGAHVSLAVVAVKAGAAIRMTAATSSPTIRPGWVVEGTKAPAEGLRAEGPSNTEMKESALNKLKTKIAAATALGLLMAEAAPVAYAAQAGGESASIDRIVTGPVPQDTILLAQGAAGSSEESEQLPPRQRQERQNQKARQAEPEQAAEEPAPRRKGQQQDGEQPARRAQPQEEPADRPARREAQQPAEEAQPRNNRRAQQPAEQQEEPVIRRVQPEQPAEAPPRREAQPAEETQPRNNRRAQPAEQAEEPAARPAKPEQRARPEQPAANEGQGQASREERLRQRREALRKLQQGQDNGAETGSSEQKPPQRAEPAQPAQPAQPSQEAEPPRQAQPAQPAEPAQPPRQAQPAEPPAATPGTGEAEQAQPNETDRERRLRERREALRKLQGEQPASGSGTVEGGPVRQPGASEPPPQQAGQPGVTEGAPENAAPILDSQKPRRGRDGKREIGEGNGTVAPPIARSPTPPPANDGDAQANAPRVDDLPSVREEEGRRVEGRPRRYERPEGADVLKEIGSRVIFELGNQILIENNDRSRLTRDSREVYYEELPRGRTRETIVRPNGVTIVTIRDRYGEVIRRSRIMPDGREYVLVYVDEDRLDRGGRGEWRDPGDDLPPLVITMPYEDYIFDAERVEYNDDQAYYDFLEQPPVEKVERLYSVDEVKRSARVRDSVRRIDLDTITFDTGSALVDDSQVEKLDGVANAMLRLLEKNPAETFLIEGHTDAVGSDMSNLALSDERAEAVAAALTEVFEVPAENLTTQGYGEQYLKIDTQAAERENRRVAIRRITPLVAPVASAQ